MSHETLPISPAAFAEALKDLPITTLHLKAAELRNSIAHLDYSNEQLLPFTTGSEPDQDCVEAIQENEIVIKRMLERIELLKKEVEENRGASWREFESKEEVEAKTLVNGDAGPSVVNGEANGTTEGHEAWRDGTFQTGRIVDGEVTLNETGDAPANGRGGRLDDEALRRAIEERMREDAEDDDGMHL